ncbi:MAG TPA: hypothetical protein DHV28_09060 [Ignavibacteriales bacterium]|nr:hypothetical protein [Ignavibacteriales bacterium]
MHESKIKSNWSNIKLKLMQNFPQLSDADLIYIDGKEEELFQNIQKKILLTREELIYLIYLYVSES